MRPARGLYCAINLSPNKTQVFRETYRALPPGDRVGGKRHWTRIDLPSEGKQGLGSWATCVDGTWMDKD